MRRPPDPPQRSVPPTRGPKAHLPRRGRSRHRPSAPNTRSPRCLVGVSLPTARRKRPSRALWTRRRRALIQVDDTQHLDALATLTNFTVDRRPFRRVLQPSLLQRRDMQEHVLRSIRWRNKPVALLWIKPLDGAAQFRAISAGIAGLLSFVHQAHSVFMRRLATCPRPQRPNSIPACPVHTGGSRNRSREGQP
jgi:hypothetical protein